MRKFLQILFLLLAIPTIVSATTTILPLEIKNHSIEVSYTPDDTLSRLTFDNVIYLNDKPFLPSEIGVLAGDKADYFNVEISSIQSVECTQEESNLIKEFDINNELDVRKSISVTQGNYSLIVYLSPYFKDGEKILRINRATINITRIKGALKAAKTPKQTYTDNSVLASGLWYKVAISESGLYKITYNEIREMGIGDPSKVRVYGYGGELINEDISLLLPRYDDLPEVAIYMEKGSDGVFSEGDYILFYGKGVISDDISEENPEHQYTYNYCSKYGYYFLTCSKDGEGKRVTLMDEIKEEVTTRYVTTLAGRYFHKSQYNILESGREWLGYKMQKGSNSYTFTISDSNIDTTSPLDISASIVNQSLQGKTFTFCINNLSSETYTLTVSGLSGKSSIAGIKGNFYRTAENSRTSNPTIQMTMASPGNDDIAYLSSLTVNYYKELILDSKNKILTITNPEDIYPNEVAEYFVIGADSKTQVWDITDPTNAKRVPVTLIDDNLSFKEDHSSFHKFIVFKQNEAPYKTVTKSGLVENQNLHALETPDMVIISPSAYLGAANKLAKFHRTNDGMTVHVVTPSTIYNEFSSGTPDVSAYRLFMKMFYDRDNVAGSKKLKYLLFVGTSSYDNRGVEIAAQPLLSYQSVNSFVKTGSYTTDDFYGLLDDDENPSIGAATMDIAVGRLPVTTTEEAVNVVNKTIKYVTESSTGNWRALCSFLGDNDDGGLHSKQANELANITNTRNNSFKTDKIFLDSYEIAESTSGSSFPEARNKILDNIKKGTLIFTYVGHGSPNTMTSEQTINKSDIISMYNDNLGLWATATCDFSRYENGIHSAGMEAILNKKGGCIALYTTTRVVVSNQNFNLMQNVFEYLIPKEDSEYKTIGEIFRLAKVGMGSNDNKLNFTLLGDPAITLHYPKNNIITDSFNSENPEDAQLKALDVVTLKGHIEDKSGNILTDFNGKITITIYDKEETLSTLGQSGQPKIEYKDYPNKLYYGTVSVNDGTFETTFMVPKDINYRVDKGKILYYAWNDATTDTDGFGNNTDFSVGGSSQVIDDRGIGPTINMYMNSPEFYKGEEINDSPVLYAHLYDKYGINIVGSGIGHDIIATLSGPSSSNITLNEYFISSLNDYKSGSIKYQFKSLPAGYYILSLKAWNLINESSTAVIDFTVNNSAKPEIEDFSFYPNPATDHTNIYLRYDRPEVPVSVTFIVYDMLWNEYWESTVTESTDGTYTAYWDLTGKYGAMASGVYCVRAKITMSDGTYTHKVKKIIIKTQ